MLVHVSIHFRWWARELQAYNLQCCGAIKKESSIRADSAREACLYSPFSVMGVTEVMTRQGDKEMSVKKHALVRTVIFYTGATSRHKLEVDFYADLKCFCAS